jgi:hypothetical protein
MIAAVTTTRPDAIDHGGFRGAIAGKEGGSW